MVVINRFVEVTNDPVLKSATADNLVRVCGNENRRDHVPRVDQMSVELEPSHSGHLNVSDQARGCSEERRCQEIGCRGERFDSVAQRRHERSHGFAKGLIILDDRDQCTFHHRGFQPAFPVLTMPAPFNASRLHAIDNVGDGSRQSNAGGPKRWLRPSAIRLGSDAVHIDGL
jgi:hypothetical protein